MAIQYVPEIPRSCFNTASQTIIDFLKGPSAVKKRCLYEHQVDAVLRVRDHFRDPSKPNIALVVLPTGCGKTGVAVLAPYALNASRVLVITPSVIISKQIYEAFVGSELGDKECFLVQREIIPKENRHRFIPIATCITRANQIRSRSCMQNNVVIVNAHKVGGNSSVSIEELPRDNFELVIVDEAHHYPANTWRLLVDHFQTTRRLFLTATPEHRGNPILPNLPQYIAYELLHAQAVEKGIIRPMKFDDQVDSEENMSEYQVGYSYMYIRVYSMQPCNTCYVVNAGYCS